MSAMASQITGISTVLSTVCSGENQRKHQSSASLAFMMGNTGHLWFPSQRASNAERVSIWWRHHNDAMRWLARNKGWVLSASCVVFWYVGPKYKLISFDENQLKTIPCTGQMLLQNMKNEKLSWLIYEHVDHNIDTRATKISNTRGF